MYTVYIHRNKINGKVYVGSTSVEPEKRWKNGGWGYQKQPHFFSDIRNYGWDNFEHLIVSRGLSKTEAIELERETIKKYDAANSECGYNMTHSGQGMLDPNDNLRASRCGDGNPFYGKKHNDDTKEKIRNYRTGRKLPAELRKKLSEIQSGENNPMWNRKQKLSSKQKMSIAKLSKKCPGYAGILNVNTGLIFATISEAAAHFNISHQNLSNCLKGRYKSSGKHPVSGEPLRWEYYVKKVI